jgi:glutaredoxin
MSVVVLYGRPGCCLCDDARRVLERMRGEHPFELIERDIETDDALLATYFERIPVIALDGEELFDFAVDEAALRARLSASRSSKAPGPVTEEGARRRPDAPRPVERSVKAH